MASYAKGLTKIELAPVANDGTVGAYVQVGDTLRGTYSFTTANGTEVNIFVEEKAKPPISETTEGPLTMKWSSIDVAAAALARLFGGAVTGSGVTEKWAAPRKQVNRVFAARVTSPTGHVLDVPQLSVFPLFDWTLTGDQVAKVNITGTVQDPDDEAVAPYTITYGAAA